MISKMKRKKTNKELTNTQTYVYLIYLFVLIDSIIIKTGLDMKKKNIDFFSYILDVLSFMQTSQLARIVLLNYLPL